MIKISKRHLAKTLSYRLLGTLDTIVLSLLISNDISIAFKIGFTELFTKMILYYFHERVWFHSKMSDSNKRHIFKTFTWRAIGTIDTIVLSWIITGNPLTGLKIGGLEVITKMVLYFLHEKLWYRINYGLDRRNRRRKLKELRKLNHKRNSK
jgi:uncharacterized membrane protein